MKLKPTKPTKVIKKSNLPAKLPIWPTLTCVLALDHWGAPQWLWGALGLLFLVGWVVAFQMINQQQEKDLFNEE